MRSHNERIICAVFVALAIILHLIAATSLFHTHTLGLDKQQWSLKLPHFVQIPRNQNAYLAFFEEDSNKSVPPISSPPPKGAPPIQPPDSMPTTPSALKPIIPEKKAVAVIKENKKITNPARTRSSTRAAPLSRITMPTQASQKISPASKPCTLAQITKHILSSTKKDGESTLIHDGNAKGIPTFEQQSLELYVSKVKEQLQSSLKTLERECPDFAEDMLTGVAYITINGDGSITTPLIVHSCGNRSVDAYILKMIHHSRNSLAPLPEAVKTRPYPLVVICTIGKELRSLVMRKWH